MRTRQYLAACGAAAALCIAQVWAILVRYGAGGANPRVDVMQQQLVEHVLLNWRLAGNLLLFILLLVVCHLVITVGAIVVYRAATGVIMKDRREKFWPSMAFMSAVILTAIFANLWLFPLSSAFETTGLLMQQALSPVLFAVLGVTCGSGAALAAYNWLVIEKRRTPLLVGVAGTMLMIVAWHHGKDGDGREASSDLPDVIVLGMDSLRPDYVSAYGGIPAGLTPAIDEALATSVLLEDARTPVARTFVSYHSFLTGRNPVKHGVRFNLYPRTEFNRAETMAWTLKHAGYSTMLAMDESRFANFDKSFGFDSVVTPRVGALDFMVGGSFDFFATNLLIAAIPATFWMSPVQGNRAAYRSYRLEDHPSRVLQAIRDAPANRPLFLVSHLCMPHWPYVPAAMPDDEERISWVRKLERYRDTPPKYLRSLVAVDRQFESIVSELRRLGRLENAIVVVMSDHGEGFGFDRDKVFLARNGLAVNDYGHGSFALSVPQTRVVMGIQRYQAGVAQWKPRTAAGAASLIDVAPTVAAELGLDSQNYEGLSWLSALRNGEDLPRDRVRFFENGLRAAGVERAHVDEAAVASEMSYLYRVTADDRFEVRPELLPEKLAGKQRGAVLGSLGVMTDPAGDEGIGAANCWQAVDYEKRTMKCVPFPAEQPEVARLQADVCRYFASDDGFGERWCRSQGDSPTSLAATP